MSPFASLLHEMRTQRGLRQFELAEMIGYEKSYLSSLEIGTKGPWDGYEPCKLTRLELELGALLAALRQGPRTIDQEHEFASPGN